MAERCAATHQHFRCSLDEHGPETKHHNGLAVPTDWADEQKVAPTQTGAVVVSKTRQEEVGIECSLCDVKFERVAEVVIRVPTDQGDVVSHPHCFYLVRAATFEQLYNQAWQLLCALVARVGERRAHIRQEDLKAAEAAGFQLDQQPTPEGGINLRLVTQVASRIVAVGPDTLRKLSKGG